MANEFSNLVGNVLKGAHPMSVVDEAVSGPDRQDDFTDDSVRVREFQKIAGECANSFPYVGPDWVTAIADELRSNDPQAQAELVDMATRNRDQYAGSARIDANGSFELWDRILHGLIAIQTHEIPPGPMPAVDRPNLA